MKTFDKVRRPATSLLVSALSLVVAHSDFPAWAEPAAKGAAPAEQAAPAQAAPADEGQAPATQPESRGDISSMTVELPSRIVAMTSGKAEWAEGFKAITEAIGKVDAAIKSAGLARGGRPFVVFLSTDEEAFQFEAMIPLAQKPDGKTDLGGAVKVGSSPPGKAIKFLHRGAYDDIESTYDLITAFLDEKGLEAQNLFIEEYLTDTKEPDDAGLEADIYVFIK